MTSSLLRMFNVAKATGAAALENFTTEALAAAIRLDPRPMIDALVDCGFKDFNQFDIVSTQVDLGEGVLDMILTSPQGHPVIWVEVKIHAGEHNGQLGRYAELAQKISATPKPKLVLLSSRQLTSDPRIVWLSWQALYNAIPATSAQWLDFKAFLKEIRMADDSKVPVTAVEATTIGGAFGLLGKVVHILVSPAQHVNKLWNQSNWPEEPKDIRRMIASRFAWWPSYTIQHRTRYRCGVTMGVYHGEETGDARLAVWLWANPRYIAERDRLWSVAEGGLNKMWERDPASWELLGAYTRLTQFASHEAASAWLINRLDELKEAGMFELLEKLGKPDSDEGEEESPT